MRLTNNALVSFRVVGVSLDRRTEDLHRRHDLIEQRRFAKRVEMNVARRQYYKPRTAQ
jgi:hypothetical protein